MSCCSAATSAAGSSPGRYSSKPGELTEEGRKLPPRPCRSCPAARWPRRYCVSPASTTSFLAELTRGPRTVSRARPDNHPRRPGCSQGIEGWARMACSWAWCGWRGLRLATSRCVLRDRYARAGGWSPWYGAGMFMRPHPSACWPVPARWHGEAAICCCSHCVWVCPGS